MADKPTVRTCVFCGHPNVTKEHVFPLWLRKVVIDEVADHMSIQLDRSGAVIEHRTYQAGAFSLEVKRVCQEECNGGWMSRLERTAQPLLQPMLEGWSIPGSTETGFVGFLSSFERW